MRSLFYAFLLLSCLLVLPRAYGQGPRVTRYKSYDGHLYTQQQVDSLVAKIGQRGHAQGIGAYLDIRDKQQRHDTLPRSPLLSLTVAVVGFGHIVILLSSQYGFAWFKYLVVVNAGLVPQEFEAVIDVGVEKGEMKKLFIEEVGHLQFC
jgi:hypothetical protein